MTSAPDLTSQQTDFTRARRNVAVLVVAQAVLGAQMPMVFIFGGLAGQMLASNVCLATLPITLIVLSSMLTATPMSNIMHRFGRRAGFFVGTAGGALGGLVGALGLYLGSFAILLAGHFLIGIYMSAHGFYRFAATDTAPETYRARAISYVLAGGLGSAILGPQLATATSGLFVVPIMGTYIAVALVNIFGAAVFLFLDIPRPPPAESGGTRGRTRWELLTTPRIAVAMICAMISYALMNLVMTSTPLAVVGCGFSEQDAGNVVSGHVFAMFAPAFFTGHLIARFGSERIVALGLAILAVSGLVALHDVALGNFFLALVLLGIGWNFGFIGATAMLTAAHEPHERGRAQGLNDLIVFGGVTLASLSSGGLMNCTGGSAAEGWTAVNLAMIPALIVAGSALAWLLWQERRVQRA